MGSERRVTGSEYWVMGSEYWAMGSHECYACVTHIKFEKLWDRAYVTHLPHVPAIAF